MTFPEITARMVPTVTEADVFDIADGLDLLHERDCHFLRVPIAESEDRRWLVTVDVGYIEVYGRSPCGGIKPIDYAMFGYEITAFDQNCGVNYQTMDPLQARCGIPDEIRHLLIEIVQNCYSNLLGICHPEYIYRFSWIEEPNENALKKHIKCTETLTQAGYLVLKTGTNQDGRKFWLLGKGDSDHSDLEQSELVNG
jgi:hypothetical protein